METNIERRQWSKNIKAFRSIKKCLQLVVTDFSKHLKNEDLYEALCDTASETKHSTSSSSDNETIDEICDESIKKTTLMKENKILIKIILFKIWCRR